MHTIGFIGSEPNEVSKLSRKFVKSTTQFEKVQKDQDHPPTIVAVLPLDTQEKELDAYKALYLMGANKMIVSSDRLSPRKIQAIKDHIGDQNLKILCLPPKSRDASPFSLVRSDSPLSFLEQNDDSFRSVSAANPPAYYESSSFLDDDDSFRNKKNPIFDDISTRGEAKEDPSVTNFEDATSHSHEKKSSDDSVSSVSTTTKESKEPHKKIGTKEARRLMLQEAREFCYSDKNELHKKNGGFLDTSDEKEQGKVQQLSEIMGRLGKDKIVGAIGGAGVITGVDFSVALSKRHVYHLIVSDSTARDKNNSVYNPEGGTFIDNYRHDIGLLTLVAEYVVIPCNTAHIELVNFEGGFLKKGTKDFGRFIHIGDATLSAVRELYPHDEKIIILATPATLKHERSAYNKERMLNYGYEPNSVIRLKEAKYKTTDPEYDIEKDKLMQIYLAIYEIKGFRSEEIIRAYRTGTDISKLPVPPNVDYNSLRENAKARILKVSEELRKKYGPFAVILGCTELHSVFPKTADRTDHKFVSSSDALAEACHKVVYEQFQFKDVPVTIHGAPVTELSPGNETSTGKSSVVEHKTVQTSPVSSTLQVEITPPQTDLPSRVLRVPELSSSRNTSENENYYSLSPLPSSSGSRNFSFQSFPNDSSRDTSFQSTVDPNSHPEDLGIEYLSIKTSPTGQTGFTSYPADLYNGTPPPQDYNGTGDGELGSTPDLPSSSLRRPDTVIRLSELALASENQENDNTPTNKGNQVENPVTKAIPKIVINTDAAAR